jgi:hypothetical protein
LLDRPAETILTHLAEAEAAATYDGELGIVEEPSRHFYKPVRYAQPDAQVCL